MYDCHFDVSSVKILILILITNVTETGTQSTSPKLVGCEYQLAPVSPTVKSMILYLLLFVRI